MLMKSNLSIIFFHGQHLEVISEKSLSYPRSPRFSPKCYFLGFLSFCILYIQVSDPFELIFVKGIGFGVQISFFACGCPVVPALFIEKPIFALLSKNKDSYYESVTGLSVSLICLFFHQYYTVLITAALEEGLKLSGFSSLNFCSSPSTLCRLYQVFYLCINLRISQ